MGLPVRARHALAPKAKLFEGPDACGILRVGVGEDAPRATMLEHMVDGGRETFRG
jgi:hypothetical protein